MMRRLSRRPRPSRAGATRLLVGSHLLLLVQSLLMLASPAGLAPPRPGVAAICLLALICLVLAAAQGSFERNADAEMPRDAV
jgi:hypothetical protein